MRITEDISADLHNPIGDVKTCDPGIGFEDILPEHCQFAGLVDCNIGQLGAIVERIAIDLRNRIGNGDGGKAAVAKGTPADSLQLVSSSKVTLCNLLHQLKLNLPI